MVLIPEVFYYNEELHKKLAIVNSDNSVIAWNFHEEDRLTLSLSHVRKNFKKAFTFGQASKLLRNSSKRIEDVFKHGLMEYPERVYNLSTFFPGKFYIAEYDMYELRQILWDLLPKNRYGIPHNDMMPSEDELRHEMMKEDNRDFMIINGNNVRIFR